MMILIMIIIIRIILIMITSIMIILTQIMRNLILIKTTNFSPEAFDNNIAEASKVFVNISYLQEYRE